ncbi:hypothetical protein ACQ4PT_049915 [Festuca glaucescens]
MAAEAGVDGDSSPAKPELVKSKDEMYMESLVGVSLLLLSEEFPLEVQLHGFKMLQHLVDRRSDQLSAAQLLNLKIQLVESATSSSPVFLSTVKRAPGFEDERVGLSLVLDNNFISSSPTSSSLHPPSVSQDETTPDDDDDDETIFHYSKERLLLLAEHNLLCEAFSIATSLLGTAQCAMIIPRLLDPLNKIWSLQGWKYFASRNGVGQLFSSHGQFLETAYHVVGFCEEQLVKRRKTQEPGGASDILLSVPLLRQILPLLLRLLQRVHALWDEEVDDLPEEIERAKSLRCAELAATLESTDGLYDTDNLHKDKTGALLEGTRQRAYNVLGLCTYIDGAFSELLDSLSVRDALSEDIGSMELRHLLKGGLEKPYFYGNLVGSDRQIKQLEQKLLLAFTREVSDLLRVLALTQQNMESASSSLLSVLLRHGFFRRMRMSLFGYFVDDETTMKDLPFCRSLTRLAIRDMSVRQSIVNDLLPFLIRRLDRQLPCAIQRLRRKLGSSTKASATKELEALCEEWYNHFAKDSVDGYTENNFTAWLTKKKKDLQVKARSAAKELVDGSDWNWEFEDEFRRYLPAYMDMVQQVDSINDYEEPFCVEQEWLFQILKPEFRYKSLNIYMYFTMVHGGAVGVKHGGSRGAYPEAVEAAET